MHLLYKKQGETCLECLERLRMGRKEGVDSGVETVVMTEAKSGLLAAENDLKNHPKTAQDAPGKELDVAPLSMTYAGRLDPLAAGLLIVLEGQAEIADKARYLDLPKTYEFEVVFGVATDTFDQLGMIVPSKEVLAWPTLIFDEDLGKGDVENGKTEDYKKLIGKVSQTYPFFSSKPIDGIPLFQYVKDHGIAATIPKLPTNEVEIYDIEFMGEGAISAIGLANESIGFANSVKGDFRQEEIQKSWEGYGRENPGLELRVAKFRMTVSSGFYVRTFACWLGQVAGTVAIARNIVRTRVGDFNLS